MNRVAIPESWGKLLTLLGEQPLEVHETHLSVVQLTAHYALKFKKPVNFGFVDYHTSALRVRAAYDELCLNRRFSSGIYLGLALQKASGTALFLEDPPAPFDESAFAEAAVVMQRVQRDAFFDVILQENRASTNAHLTPLVQFLAGLFLGRRLAVAEPSTFVQAWLRAAKENFEALETKQVQSILTPALNAALSHARESLHELANNKLFINILSRRAQSGSAIDGHGDLRLEHVVFLDGRPHLIDCVEFSEALRRNDLAAEIAFLIMELFHARRVDLANSLAIALAEKCSDQRLPDLLPPFVAYRAMVRAKVHALRAVQLSTQSELKATELSQVARYVGLANRMGLTITKRSLVVMCGTTGSGKSACARSMAALFDFPVVRSDAIRRELFPDVDGSKDKFGSGMYSEESTQRTYKELLRQAAELLEHGNDVILDAAFPSPEKRAQALALARAYGATAVLIHLDPSASIQEQRLAARSQSGLDISHGRPEILPSQRANFTIPSCTEGFDSFIRLEAQADPIVEAWNAICQVFDKWSIS